MGRRFGQGTWTLAVAVGGRCPAAAHRPRSPSGGSPCSDFSGGGYFDLDTPDRAVVPTTTGHIWVVGESGNGFALERDYDVTAAVPPGDKIESALPDWSGRIWFVSAK